MKNIAPQHIEQPTLRTYYLSFNENGDKSQELLDVLMNSLLEFVFGINHIATENPKLHADFFNACEKLYKEKRNPQKEGDLGEIILHTLLRKYVGTIPFTGRFYFSIDKNTNAKGFDVIHVLPKDNKDILVLGESKMYAKAKSGIDALVADIKKHFNAEYTRKQFIKIKAGTHSDDPDIQTNIVIPTKTSIAEWEIKLRTEKSLDKVIDELYVPLLCTYNSDNYTNHKNVSDEFLIEYEKEIQELHEYFISKSYTRPNCLNVLLMLFPIPDKDQLINEYYKRIDLEVKKYDDN